MRISYRGSILRSDRLTRSPSSGSTPRCNGEYQPISRAGAGIGKTPLAYAARVRSASNSRDTPIRSSCRHEAGDPNGEAIPAIVGSGQCPVVPMARGSAAFRCVHSTCPGAEFKTRRGCRVATRPLEFAARCAPGRRRTRGIGGDRALGSGLGRGDARARLSPPTYAVNTRGRPDRDAWLVEADRCRQRRTWARSSPAGSARWPAASSRRSSPAAPCAGCSSWRSTATAGCPAPRPPPPSTCSGTAARWTTRSTASSRSTSGWPRPRVSSPTSAVSPRWPSRCRPTWPGSQCSRSGWSPPSPTCAATTSTTTGSAPPW